MMFLKSGDKSPTWRELRLRKDSYTEKNIQSMTNKSSDIQIQSDASANVSFTIGACSKLPELSSKTVTNWNPRKIGNPSPKGFNPDTTTSFAF